MPCNSDYLLPNEKERNTSEAAQLLVYLKTSLGEPVTDSLLEDAHAIEAGTYPDASNLNTYVVALCDWLQRLTPQQKRTIIHVPHPTAKMLKKWWEEHEEADRKRLAAEAKALALRNARLFMEQNPIERMEPADALKSLFANPLTDDSECADCPHVYHWHFERDRLPSGRTGCGHPNCPCTRFNWKK